MVPRGSCPLLFLTLILLAACLAQFRPPNSFQWFVREQVDFPKTSATNDHRYCNVMMPRWNLTTPFCKSTHTFTHAPASQPQAICGHGGTSHRCYHCDSKSGFCFTTCRVVPACTY
ncbi:ribonuclease-like [Chrysemys picta bellii]|uniref:ribonuclease-like n=1 Tax=Chrysemys picta bellii TaxID=8478 RepID=UPI0032B0F3CE